MRVIIFICSVLLTVVSGEVLDVKYCEGEGSEQCTVEALRVTPCSNPKKACVLRRKHNATIEIDFTPKFVADKLEGVAVWANGPSGEIEFAGMDKDACKFTTCPTVEGGSQTYTYALRIGQKIPAAAYQLKWRLYDPSTDSNKCCIKFNIRIR